MPRPTLLAFALLALVTLPLAGLADDIPATRLTLNETASREVEQDTIVARLAATARGETAAGVQAAVNQAMVAALGAAREVEGVRPATGGYRVYQRYDREGRPRAWEAEQDLMLEGGDPALVLELVGGLQEAGLSVRTLGFQLSRPVRLEVEDELTLEAIDRLRNRAAAIAEALGMAVEGVAVLEVGGAIGIAPRPMFEARMAAAEEAAPPPSAVPDRETVSVDVRAEIHLR